MQEKQPMSEVIKETIDKVKNLADTKTVIGDPITLIEGVTILPFPAFRSVRLSAAANTVPKKDRRKEQTEKVVTDNFGGGGGTAVTVTPVAFLVITADGETRLLNIGENTGYLATPYWEP